MNVLDLAGCAPTPLAHYLKALGILRLVAEQVDPQARGWWEGERFRLATVLSRKDLEEFFLHRYEPTPMFNPWGARSGFFPGNSESSARAVLSAIENSPDARFSPYRSVIQSVRAVLSSTTGGKKPSDNDKAGKMKLILALRNNIRGKSTLWMNTVVSVVDSGIKGIEFPALFGTGGSEGSGSYTSAFMSAIEQSLLLHAWDHALETAVFGVNRVPNCDWNQSMGQYIPAGSATPWDLLLAFEGACVVRSAVSTRSATEGTRWLASPYFVAPASYGYASGGRLDEYALNKGKELPGRGEQWFPLWKQPMVFSELMQMYAEGRAATKKNRVSDGWSMVRAVSSLGVRQGISEFVRFGYLQRNNLATHFAVPLGRFRVPERIAPRLSCLDDLDGWLPRLHRDARNKHSPARLRLVERRLSEALFAVAQHAEEPNRWQSVLLTLADVERVHVTNSGLRSGPIPKLRPDWVPAADDGSPEFRLAVTCALQNAIRRHWIPRKNDETAAVLNGRNGQDDAIALVERRLIEAGQRGERRLPLLAAYRASAAPADLAALVAGQVDLDRTMALARALMAIDGRAWAEKPSPAQIAPAGDLPDDAWLAIRLAMLPWALPNGKKIGADPAIFRRLASGDGQTAVELALRRLSSAGICPSVRVAAVTPETSRLWAAALAFPITPKTAEYFLFRLDPIIQKETPHVH